jgi:hypothetical protein
MATFHRQETVGSIVGDVLGTMGLEVPLSFFGSTEATVAQMMRLANSAGQQLSMLDYKWQFQNAEFTITTIPAVAAYALPADFNGFVSDSQWNRTTRLPALGSLQEYEWQMLKARNLAGVTFTQLFRVQNDTVEFAEAPTSIQTIVLPYTSRGWLADGTTPTIRYDEITADSNLVLFDGQLFRAMLKFLWNQEKGFDMINSERNLVRILAAAKANDSPGRTLSLASPAGYPYLGTINVPPSGFGS